MTRLMFGGGPEDVYQLVDSGTGFTKPGGGFQALFYSDSGKQNRYTDLLSASQQPISSMTTQTGSDGLWSVGQITPFYGPDGVYEMWVSVAGSPPFLMQASNLGSYAGPILQQLTQLLTAPAPSLSTLTDVDSTAMAAATVGQAIVKLAGGLYGPGTVASGGGGSGDATLAGTQTFTGTKTFAALLTLLGGLTAKPLTVAAVAAIVQALAGQTANLQEWRNSAGAALSWVGPDGNIYAPNVGKAFVLSKTGTLSTGTGTLRQHNDTGTALKIRSIRASVGTPSTATAPVFDVRVNGTTVYATTANRPTIPINNNTSGKSTGFNSGATIPDGAYVTADIVTAGTGTADAVIQIDTW